jgi:hypothetical protein
VASEQMLDLAVIAKEFGQRPSSLVGIEDPVLAINFDAAGVARLLQAREAAREETPDRLEF